MKKRFKMPSGAFSPVETAQHIGRRDKIHPALVFVVFWAVVAMLAASFSPAAAQDRKTRVITFQASGLKTAGISYSSPFEVSPYTEAQIFVDVTAEAEPSTLDVVVQVSPDQITWYTHTTVGQIAATGQTRAPITNIGNYMRIKSTVGGTSMTFSVVGVFKN